MQEVTLTQILAAREERVRKQHMLLTTYQCPIICFTMNIAGPIKTSPLIERAFKNGLELLDNKLPQNHIRFYSTETSVTGCLAMYAVNSDAITLKKICTEIEDATPLGRLFDLDVLDKNGLKLERYLVNGKDRNCIVCGAPGRNCAARRLHTVSELQTVTNDIIYKHFAVADRAHIALLAMQCLIDEVVTTPKPGLVDKRNNGSHLDMNLDTFILSAHALRPYFEECVKIGQETKHLNPEDTFSYLREAGILAEKTMYTATGGVNTHKGAIYSLGILCGALGRLWTPEKPIAPITTLLKHCSEMASPHVTADFAKLTHAYSAGQQLYLTEGITGIRGEAAAGFPSVAKIGLPVFQNALEEGLTHNDAGVLVLLHLITHVTDTNLHHRGGRAGATYAATSTRTLLNTFRCPSHEQIEELDDAFIARNLSPGGCADLLAIIYFLYALNTATTFSQTKFPKVFLPASKS